MMEFDLVGDPIHAPKSAQPVRSGICATDRSVLEEEMEETYF
jgi:hypothetical protein